MKKYKVTNKLEIVNNLGNIRFRGKETKILSFKPTSDRFIVEEIIPKRDEVLKRIKLKGGKK